MKYLLILVFLVGCGKPEDIKPTENNIVVECVALAPECSPNHILNYSLCGVPKDYCYYSCKQENFIANPNGSESWRVNDHWYKGTCNEVK